MRLKLKSYSPTLKGKKELSLRPTTLVLSEDSAKGIEPVGSVPFVLFKLMRAANFFKRRINVAQRPELVADV